jgi:hypothetical protein
MACNRDIFTFTFYPLITLYILINKNMRLFVYFFVLCTYPHHGPASTKFGMMVEDTNLHGFEPKATCFPIRASAGETWGPLPGFVRRLGVSSAFSISACCFTCVHHTQAVPGRSVSIGCFFAVYNITISADLLGFQNSFKFHIMPSPAQTLKSWVRISS